MKVDEQVWSMVQQRMGYSDQEMSQFRADPRNEEVLAKAPELMNKTIIAEVIHSHGCNSQHKVGDKIYMDGAGNLISKLCPERMCVHLVKSFSTALLLLMSCCMPGSIPTKCYSKRLAATMWECNAAAGAELWSNSEIEDRKK